MNSKHIDKNKQNYILFVFLVLLKISFSQENYIDYQKAITKAETCILDSNYTRALEIYDSTFQEYDFVFLKHCITACEVACELKKNELAFNLLRRAVKQGYKLNSLNADKYNISTNNKIMRLSSIDKDWGDFLKDYDSLRNIYITSIDWELRRKINNLYDLDQKWRDKHELHPWNFLWRPFIWLKWKSVVGKIVEDELVPIIKEKGYPGEKLIGVSEKNMHHKFNIDFYSHVQTGTIFIHFFSSKRKHFDDSIFLDEVKKGNLNINSYCSIQNFNAQFSKNKKTKGKFYFHRDNYSSKKFNKMKEASLESVNKRRFEIGLSDCATEKRKHEYYMKQLRNKDLREKQISIY